MPVTVVSRSTRDVSPVLRGFYSRMQHGAGRFTPPTLLDKNDVVIVPTFNDRNDRVALNILADAFPEREVVGIHAVDLVWGLGTLHCLTQQQPRSERRTGS